MTALAVRNQYLKETITKREAIGQLLLEYTPEQIAELLLHSWWFESLDESTDEQEGTQGK